MKKTAVILFGLITSGLHAQDIEIPFDGSFTEIKLFNKIEAKLIPSTENKIIAKGVEKEEVEAEIRNGTLRIKTELDQLWSEDDTMVEIYCKEKLEVIDVNEGSTLSFDDELHADEITLSAQEGARIAGPLTANYLEAKIYSGGSIYVKGTAERQLVKIKAGGEYEGESFITEETEVTVSAGGDANVHATQSCKARVNAGGSIYIYGDPSTLDKKTTFGGKIVKKAD